jgi:hypothetical protein
MESFREIGCQAVLWNLKIYHCHHKSLPLHPAVIQFHPVHTFKISIPVKCILILSFHTYMSPKWSCPNSEVVYVAEIGKSILK